MLLPWWGKLNFGLIGINGDEFLNIAAPQLSLPVSSVRERQESECPN
jgi:hypothetical protein